jgi:flagellar motor switch protein FliM
MMYNVYMEKRLTLKINGESLLQKSAQKTNLHRLHMKSGVTYPTMRNMMLGRATNISLDILSAILLALMPAEEIMELKMGDVFKFEEKNEKELSVYRKR